MRVAHLGTFDVNNYGDLLFPLIAQWRLPNVRWIHASPRGGPCDFVDAANSRSISELLAQKPDAVVVGGGNILHLRRTALPSYRGIGGLAYPALLLGATYLACKNHVPMLINGPSIRRLPFGVFERMLLGRVIRLASYLALRDDFSIQIAREVGAEAAYLIPDTAFDVSRMWPTGTLPQDGSSENYVAVHVNHRYGGNADQTARALDRIGSTTGAKIHFLPIGPCHGDVEYMREVAARIRATNHQFSELSLKLFAGQIARSRAYIGSSMHGFITAISYGVPALLVLNETPMEKFSGVLDVAGAPPSVICCSWSEASSRFENVWGLSSEGRDRIFAALDRHWERVEAVLADSRTGCSILATSGIFRYWRQLARISQFEVGVRGAFSKLARKLLAR